MRRCYDVPNGHSSRNTHHLALDVEIVDAARKLALSRSHSLGQVISELARRGLARELGQSVHRGFPVFRVPRNAPPLSVDDVKRDEDRIH